MLASLTRVRHQNSAAGDVAQQQAARIAIKIQGHPVGSTAHTLYEQHRDRVGVVLTDLTMPLMDGVTLIRALRAIDPRVRIIAASGVEADVPGVQAYLRKPYSAERLLEAVRAALTPS